MNIDFNWTDRDQITNYLIKRYGDDSVALLATYQTFKGKSIVRELGRVLGLPKEDIDTIVREPHASNKHHPLSHSIFKYGRALQGFPQHLSIHAGGLIIAKNELSRYGSRQLMPKGFAITQFDMHHASQMGFHKLDILSQRGIGHIGDAVKIVRQNKGSIIKIHDLHLIKNDRLTLRQLASGDALGCFYIESPAMRGLLHKLKCNSYPDLIAAASIIRPGVAKSGMMQAYIRRRLGARFSYLHPVLANLKDTFGIMVYQEDVMQVVSAFAGFDLYQADMLRRLMTGKQKDRSVLTKLRSTFVRSALSRGHQRSLVLEIWRQIQSFSGYAFCKAHSATYAAESMQSLYLKAHYPAEFLVAVINNFGGFYSTEVYVRALQKVAQVHPPCLNRSKYLTSISGDDVYLGFVHVKGLQKSTVRIIADARAKHGWFRTLAGAMKRLQISLAQWQLLISVGAMAFTKREKYDLHREVLRVSNSGENQTATLFDVEVPDCTGVHDPESSHQTALDEMATLGFSLDSPFRLLREALAPNIVLASQMTAYQNRQVQMAGYFIIHKPVTTANGKHMCFAAFEDPQGDYFDTIHFPAVLDKYPLHGRGLYLLEGKVVTEFDFPSLEVQALQRLPIADIDHQKDEDHYATFRRSQPMGPI